MAKTLSIIGLLKLHDLGTASVVFLNHLDEIDPDEIPQQNRIGFENTLRRIHQKIHDYQQRSQAAPSTLIPTQTP